MSGRPLDRSKVSKRFKEACRAAGVRPVRFHDLRHTFGTRLAATGQLIRSIQEFLGHADVKTTQIYMHYAPSERELAMVNEAFPPRSTGSKTGSKLRKTEENSEQESSANRDIRDWGKVISAGWGRAVAGPNPVSPTQRITSRPLKPAPSGGSVPCSDAPARCGRSDRYARAGFASS